ncbi:MAG: nucleoside triphosphate pyrophosphohydrolase [Hyphomicrobium sp.]|nr:nucleoside triphosphate pyrophosphohydrolase [Hyphomicrobium sp.]
MTDLSDLPEAPLARLLTIMRALRTPGTGCPWDLEQTFGTIAPYTIEEAYEVADAIERGDLADLREELGDLLLQVVYHAQMAEEAGAFDFDAVADGIGQKMIRRHPHVFGTPEERARGAETDFWARIKAGERAAKAAERERLRSASADEPSNPPRASLLDDVPVGLPGLTRALKLQEKAARVGFDWPSLAPVFEKLREELAEFEVEALPADPRGDGDVARRDRVEEEYGDLLFVMANIGRHLAIDPEAALRRANAKFTRRFRHIEARLAEMGRTPDQSTLEEMDAFWNEVRAAEKR